MARTRTKPINPYISSLMVEKKVRWIKDLTVAYPGLDDNQIYAYADILDGEHQVFRALLRDSQALGLTADEFIRKLLGIEEEPSADTQRVS